METDTEETFTLSLSMLVAMLHRTFSEGVIYGYIDGEFEVEAEPNAAFDEDGQKRWCVSCAERLPALIKEISSP